MQTQKLQNTLPTLEQFSIKCQQYLQNLNYSQLAACLSNISSIDDVKTSDLMRQTAFQQILNHLANIYDFKGSNTCKFDVDNFLELITYTIKADLKSQQPLLIDQIVLRSLNDDPKYTFIIYRSHSLHFTKQRTEQYLSTHLNTVRHLKYLHSSPLFLQFILSSKNQQFVQDFCEVLKNARNSYEELFTQQNIMKRQTQKEDLQTENKLKEEQSLISLIMQIYLKLCDRLLTRCLNLALTLQNNQSYFRKISRVLQQLVSTQIFVGNVVESHKIEHAKLCLNIEKLILLRKNSLSISSLLEYPLIFYVFLLRSKNFSPLMSQQSFLFILYRILIKIGPQNTLNSRVGGFSDQLDPFLQDVIINICKLIKKIDSNYKHIKVEGEKIYLGQTYIDLIQIYKKIAIYSGFVTHESGKQCSLLIKDVLAFSSDRFKQCPRLSLSIWSKLLSSSLSAQLPFRKYCITHFRKHLLVPKQVITQNNSLFETHNFHSHAQIFIIAYQSLQKQLNIILKMDGSNFESDYIGHVMSFVTNWLLMVRLWIQSLNQNQRKVLWKVNNLQKYKKNVNWICKQVQSKFVEIFERQRSKQEGGKSTEIELILFRCKQLNFD